MFDLFKFLLIKISIIVLFVSCSNEDKIKQLEIVETNKNPNLKSCCDKINKIDFINKNEIFCFLGHNGAGKTTSLNVLSGKLKPSKGTVVLNINGKTIDIQKDTKKA